MGDATCESGGHEVGEGVDGVPGDRGYLIVLAYEAITLRPGQKTEARFARWCGVAPVAMSSGECDGPPRNHRLDLGGNRRVNSVLHIVHVTQARCHPEAQAYMTRRAAENKSKRAARRAHKRQLANVIIRRMWNDVDNLAHANSTPSSAAA